VVGFVIGGATVAAVGTGTALAIDSATFAVSALLLLAWVRHRDAPAARESLEGVWKAVAGGVRLVFDDPYLRAVLGLAWLAAFYAVPQGLAVPYSFELGGGPATVGLLLAAYPLGMSAGALLFSRWVRPELRLRLMGPLAIVACGILLLCVGRPGLVMSLVIFTVSGVASCYQLAASVAFMTRVPDEMRGRAYGLAQAGLSIGQGAAILMAGAAAESWSPSTVIAATGAVGAVVALPLALAWRRATPLPAH
jgi:predicted MFS family arabinose efflux permease